MNDKYKSSRIFYILEAALEYFISILVTGAYLAKLTEEIGLSDSLTGILSAFTSLGCGFQLFAIFLANKRPVKRWVTILHIINQLFFALVYLVPFINVSQSTKIVFFIVFLLLGHAINNVVNSPKINWFMSLVDNDKRGRFTANKEIVSLISGIVFSFFTGIMIDHYQATNNNLGAFVFCGIGIFGLMVLHSLTLIFSKEKPIEEKEKSATEKLLGKLVKDKTLFKVVLVSVLWNVAHFSATPFYGSYQNKELGFSMTFISVLSMAYAVCRSLFSKPLGNYADKHSFTKMLNICFIIAMVAFSINVFTTPANGKFLYTIYYMLYAISMAGINSSTINLIYDYVDKEKRVGALAISSTFSGIAGFLTTLAVSPLISYIQSNGNTLFGLNVYAQQVASLISVVLIGILLIYLNTVVKKLDNKQKNNLT